MSTEEMAFFSRNTDENDNHEGTRMVFNLKVYVDLNGENPTETQLRIERIIHEALEENMCVPETNAQMNDWVIE